MKSKWRVRNRLGEVIAEGETGEVIYKDGFIETPLPAIEMASGESLEVDPPEALSSDITEALQTIINIVESEYGWQERSDNPEHRESWKKLEAALDWIDAHLPSEHK